MGQEAMAACMGLPAVWAPEAAPVAGRLPASPVGSRREAPRRLPKRPDSRSLRERRRSFARGGIPAKEAHTGRRARRSGAEQRCYEKKPPVPKAGTADTRAAEGAAGLGRRLSGAREGTGTRFSAARGGSACKAPAPKPLQVVARPGAGRSGGSGMRRPKGFPLGAEGRRREGSACGHPPQCRRDSPGEGFRKRGQRAAPSSTFSNAPMGQ